jgi:DNA-binding winged helix-turn-helix (wHTH) protein/tetratricopeptide (TPR) repeat protein
MLPAAVPNSVVRFGVFEADLRSSELRKNGVRVKIQDLPFRALKLLLSRPNEVLSRDQFRQALWPEGVFVDFDHGISSAINRLRDALGDSADNPVFVETVERRGYRWIAPTWATAPSTVPIWTAQTHGLTPPVPAGPVLVKTDLTKTELVKAGLIKTDLLKPENEAPAAKAISSPLQGSSLSGSSSTGTTAIRSTVPVSSAPALPASGSSARGSMWSLLFLLAALILAVGILGLSHHASNAGTATRSLAALRTEAKPADASAPTASPAHSASPEAEQFYLKGRFYWEKRTPDGLNKAVDYFTQAIVHDSNYAPAYVGLADCYNLLREYTVMPASEAYPRALAAAKRAVELDDHSSEAHASLAFALFYGNWDAAGADHEFRRAIELNPNSSVAHHWYATYLGSLGRNTEALAEIQRAQALDPASKSTLADEGDILWSSGRRQEGTALLKQLEASEPDFVSPHRYLKTAYFASGDYAHYLEEWKQEATLMRDPSGLKLVDTAEKGLAAGGVQGMLQNIRTLQKSLYERGLQSPYLLAETDAFLGNKQEAFTYLNISFDKHEEYVAQIGADPAFNSLHDDPAYKDLVARIGFSVKK